MGCLGNLIWFIFGGCEAGLVWFLTGCAWCCTIVGIPVGLQCFKIATLTLFPFGKEISYKSSTVGLVMNVFWFLLPGIWLAMGHAVLGLLYCCTIIGIPFGIQHFKLAQLSLMPFGASID